MQLPEIPVIEKAAHHVLGDLPRGVLVELAPRHESKIAIGTSQRGLETRMEKASALDHDHASGAAIRMAVGSAGSLALPAALPHPRRRSGLRGGPHNPSNRAPEAPLDHHP